jgi:VIT1/CCC1 family predicted Fe2+/Mn2+ transporter
MARHFRRITLRRASQAPRDHRIERRAMTIEQLSEPATSNQGRQAGAPPARWGRPLAVTTAIVFCVSSAFPVVAGFVTNRATWPRWWGVLDVAIAFVLAMLALAVIGIAQGKVNKAAEDATYRAYRVLIHGIFAMMVVFFLFGDRIVWSNCLTGFAWRGWLLCYTLPAWLTVLGGTPRLGGFLRDDRRG